jgi:predicted TIM-barrel fold metal-dependent hydrolase
MPDDPRISDLWEAAAALSVPILIHTADPVAFFRPLDRFNERWYELHRRPDWHFYGPQFPPFDQLISSLYRLIEAHPNTAFITAHVGCYPEDLGFVSRMMDRYPNLYTDISARIAELGRAPYSAREWFLKYADRILFGTDQRPRMLMYQTHFRFLETADEYFDYAPDSEIPPQGRWRIYGMHLPDEVLEQVYRANAARLLKLG